MKVKTVPKRPNVAIFAMFSKNFYLLILNPVAYIINGKKYSNNTLGSNFIHFAISIPYIRAKNTEINAPNTIINPVSCPN